MMTASGRMAALRVTVAAIAAAFCLAIAAPAGAQSPPGTYAPEDDFTAAWTRAQALKVRPDPTNTKPRIPADFPVMTEDVWIWDTWPLTNMQSKPISYRGWSIIFSLTAPRNVPFGDRHWYARIGYFYSRNARDWTYGGQLFPGAIRFGSREWAGSTVLTGDEVHVFYTASGGDDAPPGERNNPLQRLATASGTIHADSRGVWFTGLRNNKIIAEPEGEMYQTLGQSQSGPIIYAFRDPFVFTDPADGSTYMLFEGNTAGVAGEYRCQPRDLGHLPPGHVVPDESRFYTGNIGLARARNANLRRWRLLPPLLSANCTNQQTERPHLVIEDGNYYLFTISHKFTFAPGIDDPDRANLPDGVYGFLGNSLRSDYRALNGSGLVLGNPADAPVQQYSEYVMPNWLVESFVDTVPGPDGDIFGGTLAPTLRLEVDGDTTYFVEQLDYGFIPPMLNAGGRALAAKAVRRRAVAH
jgi:levansucrase